MERPIRVWLAGASGLVGREALVALLGDSRVALVLAPVRRPLGRSDPRLEALRVDFERLEQELSGADAAICCLGTTLKRAGSQAAFRKVDHDYVLALGRAARDAGVRHFLVVTALGASPRSRIFYNRVKGEVEAGLEALSFPALTVVRPSLLLGEREDVRLGERLMAPLSRLLPRSISGIEARTVGRALARLACEPASGRRVVLSGELHALGA